MMFSCEQVLRYIVKAAALSMIQNVMRAGRHLVNAAVKITPFSWFGDFNFLYCFILQKRVLS